MGCVGSIRHISPESTQTSDSEITSGENILEFEINKVGYTEKAKNISNN